MACLFALCAFGLVVSQTAWLGFLLLGVLVLLMAALLAPLYLRDGRVAERVRREFGREPREERPAKALAASPRQSESR